MSQDSLPDANPPIISLKPYYDDSRTQFDQFNLWKTNNLPKILQYNPSQKLTSYQNSLNDYILTRLSQSQLSLDIQKSVQDRCINYFLRMIKLRIQCNNLFPLRERRLEELQSQISLIEQQESTIRSLDPAFIPRKHDESELTSVLSLKKKLVKVTDAINKLETIDDFIEEIFLDFEEYVDDIISQTIELNLKFIKGLDFAFKICQWSSSSNGSLETKQQLQQQQQQQQQQVEFMDINKQSVFE